MKYRTIKIWSDTHPKLKRVAAMNDETILDTIERMVETEFRRLKIIYKGKPKGGE